MVRDRYRLAKIITLAPSPDNRCDHCKNFFGDTKEHILLTSCCNRKIHSGCLKKAKVCKYCGEGWTVLPCCRCNLVIHSRSSQRRTRCCAADLHDTCVYSLYDRECPSCGEKVDIYIFPKEIETVEEFVRRRIMIRRNERERAGVVLQ